MQKVIKYMTVDMILYDSYKRAMEHEEWLKTIMKEAIDKIKFYDEDFKEIPVTIDRYIDSFDEAYSFCQEIAILDTLSDELQKYILNCSSLSFPPAPGVYKLNEDCDWELVK